MCVLEKLYRFWTFLTCFYTFGAFSCVFLVCLSGVNDYREEHTSEELKDLSLEGQQTVDYKIASDKEKEIRQNIISSDIKDCHVE